MSYEINTLLDQVIEHSASDLHLQVHQQPMLRVSGGLRAVEGPALTSDDTEALMAAITPLVPRAVEAVWGSRFWFFLPQ